LFDRHAALQSANQIDFATPGVAKRRRRRHRSRRAPQLGAYWIIEAGRQDADDRIGEVAKCQPTADHVWRTPVALLPEPVAGDDDGCRSVVVVSCGDGSAEHGVDAEHVEKCTGYRRAVHVGRHTVDGHHLPDRAMPRDSSHVVEEPALAPDLFDFGIAKRIVGEAGCRQCFPGHHHTVLLVDRERA